MTRLGHGFKFATCKRLELGRVMAFRQSLAIETIKTLAPRRFSKK
jgi:hypothetical protein